ncbi:MAG: S16 family serine protease [Nitrospiraceae bacterium]
MAGGQEKRTEQVAHAMIIAPGTHRPGTGVAVWLTVVLNLLLLVAPGYAQDKQREQLIPILGVTMGEEPTGIVEFLILSFEERHDRVGLSIQFRNAPGRFSRMAQTAVEQAIYRTANVAGLSTDSWTVVLSIPHSGLTVYGESLSAMVALSVVALAKGEFIPSDRVITGAVSPDGHIAPVGGLSFKVAAAGEAHLRRVLVPDALDQAEDEWRTPFLVHVSPVGSISQAYHALTDHPLRP